MSEARVAVRTRTLEAHGATPSTIDELLAYSAKPFEEPVCPTFPLADEPHVDVWRRYATDATSDGCLRRERRIGKFMRSFNLPVQIDPNKVEAKFQNGVLELVLPKAENVKPRTIKISASAKLLEGRMK